MNNIHLTHGFNVSDGGKKTTGTLVELFESLGFNVIQHRYGWLGPLGVLWRSRKIASTLKDKVSDWDIGLGHSHGCYLLVKSVKKGAKFDTLILLQPALKKNIKFPPNINNIIIIHNSHDKAVVAAKWYRRIVFWRDDFNWGEMGNTGYIGDDPRVINIELFRKHSNLFKPHNREKFHGVLRNIIKGDYQ